MKCVVRYAGIWKWSHQTHLHIQFNFVEYGLDTCAHKKKNHIVFASLNGIHSMLVNQSPRLILYTLYTNCDVTQSILPFLFPLQFGTWPPHGTQLSPPEIWKCFAKHYWIINAFVLQSLMDALISMRKFFEFPCEFLRFFFERIAWDPMQKCSVEESACRTITSYYLHLACVNNENIGHFVRISAETVVLFNKFNANGELISRL